MKVCLIILLIIFLVFLAYLIFNYITELIEMFYARACLIQTIDQITRMFKYQQIILSDIGIPMRTSICRQNFNDLLKNTYDIIIQAYHSDFSKKSKVLNPEHFKHLKESYEANLNSINILLLEYDTYNVRYSYAKDKLLGINRWFQDYPFLEGDIDFRRDNGIENSSAIYG